MILAIDPGIRGCGVALFDPTGELAFARYVRNSVKEGDGPAALVGMAHAVCATLAARLTLTSQIKTLIVEWPQVYRGPLLKGDPNDLLALAGVDGAIAALFPQADLRRFKPAEWKNQIPPNVCAMRIVNALKDHERPRFDRFDQFLAALLKARASDEEIGGTDHNTADAIGIGLKFVGRFERQRVIHR